MAVKRWESPDAETFEGVVEAAFRDGAILTVQANCEVEYDGRTSGYLGPGDRVLIAKPDGTFLVHQPGGHKPVNWMPAGGTISARVSEGDPVLLARRVNPRERVEVRIDDVYGVTRFDAEDGATYEESGTEAEMHEYIEQHPEELEAGLRIVEHERETTYGFLDFYAVDDEGRPVVIEVKRIQATLNHFDQLKRYVELFEGNEAITSTGADGAVTDEEGDETAAADEEGDETAVADDGADGAVIDDGTDGAVTDDGADEALIDDEDGAPTRVRGEDVRGMLVAPSASERVRRALRDADLEFVELSEFGLDATGATEAKLTDF